MTNISESLDHGVNNTHDRSGRRESCADMGTSVGLSQGSPRYGIRTDEGTGSDRIGGTPAIAVGPEHVVRQASRLGLHHLAAAIDHRLTRTWADEDDPLTVRLRAEHPETLKEAAELVKSGLGTNMKWLKAVQDVHDSMLSPVTERRKRSGKIRSATWQRGALLVTLPAPAAFVMAAGFPLEALVAVGVGSVLVAAVLGESITAGLRLPVVGKIRSTWLEEIRSDIVDATFLALLQRRNSAIDARTAKAAARGWHHIQFVASKVDETHSYH
ncbi:hypothetical protein [Arthrobacter sp. H14]|uniref:hypothetical protein n=1 Tax=Arthrobacter sp. H14 TaxID=1312959 RepID=UPI0004B2E523|nr:hypothetical protein [Arthrobacter sp. H14]